MKRIFDLFLSLCLVPVLLVPILVIAVLVRLTSKGPALYWSDRVGVGNEIFKMPKFRTMRQGTPAVATHLLTNPEKYVTPVGKLLRKLSIDELPQLFTVLKREMSFVGRRPALFNQYDLMELRTQRWQGLFLIWNRRSTQIDADGITPLLHCGGFSHWSNLPRLWRMKLPPDEDDIVILT